MSRIVAWAWAALFPVNAWAFTGTAAHSPDIGGTPTLGATDLMSEGVLIPPLRLYRGEINRMAKAIVEKINAGGLVGVAVDCSGRGGAGAHPADGALRVPAGRAGDPRSPRRQRRADR